MVEQKQSKFDHIYKIIKKNQNSNRLWLVLHNQKFSQAKKCADMQIKHSAWFIQCMKLIKICWSSFFACRSPTIDQKRRSSQLNPDWPIDGWVSIKSIFHNRFNPFSSFPLYKCYNVQSGMSQQSNDFRCKRLRADIPGEGREEKWPGRRWQDIDRAK